MKRWAIVTILLYAAILVLLVYPVACLAFWNTSIGWAVFCEVPPLWAWLGLTVACQIAMLALPVRIGQRRPVTRIWIFWPMLAAGVMFVVLAVGMGFVGWEMVWRLLDDNAWTEQGWPMAWAWSLIALVATFWIVWAIVFGFYSGRTEPAGLVRRIVRWLIAGSIVELLVAIPAHVYARSKDECCGGIGTTWGLAAGIAVMLFAFGPGVFMLFTRRLRSIQPKDKSDLMASEGNKENK